MHFKTYNVPLYALLGFLLPLVAMSAPIRYYLTPSHPPSSEKVFVIGLSKTGTTSFGDALAHLKYRRAGWHDVSSRFLTRAWHAGNIRPLLAMTEYYDAFEDLPWALVYKEMATAHPSAKFILTTRASDDIWLRSAQKHTRGRKWDGHVWVYGAYEADGNEEAYLNAYRAHTQNVREFFAQPGNEGRLLEVVIDEPVSDEARWQELVDFLDLDMTHDQMQKLGTFPRSNQSQSWGNRDPWGLFMGVDRLMFVVENGLANLAQGLGYFTAMMS